MLGNLVMFLPIVVLALMVPGPDFAVVVRNAARDRAVGWATAAGTVSGLCVHMVAAGLGLSAVLTSSATAFTVVKVAGAAYLILLGAQALLGAHRDARASGDGPGRQERSLAPGRLSRGRAFREGLLTNVLNPKAALFFVSLLPQFLDPDSAVLPQTLALSLVTVGCGAVWWVGVVAVVDRLRSLLGRPVARRSMERITGITFIALGTKLATTRPA